MDDINDVSLEPLVDSLYLKPYRMHFTQNGHSKTWDLIKLHESVVILIYNVDNKTLVLVRQFRPAVYYNGIPNITSNHIDTTKHPGSLGVTLELCAGIVDKSSDLFATAKEEVLEECGYDVPLECFKKVITYRAGVGVSGELQTLFYVEVKNHMKVSEGGGVAEEGEMIEVIEMTLPEVKAYLNRENVTSPGGLLFAFTWFLTNMEIAVDK